MGNSPSVGLTKYVNALLDYDFKTCYHLIDYGFVKNTPYTDVIKCTNKCVNMPKQKIENPYFKYTCDNEQDSVHSQYYFNNNDLIQISMIVMPISTYFHKKRNDISEYIQLIDYLITKGYNLNHIDDLGNTTSHFIGIHGIYNMVAKYVTPDQLKLLNKQNLTPYLCAKQHDAPKTLEALYNLEKQYTEPDNESLKNFINSLINCDFETCYHLINNDLVSKKSYTINMSIPIIFGRHINFRVNNYLQAITLEKSLPVECKFFFYGNNLIQIVTIVYLLSYAKCNNKGISEDAELTDSYIKLIDHLITMGHDINHVDDLGNTTTHIMVLLCSSPLLKKYTTAIDKVVRRNKNNQTPYVLAQKMNFPIKKEFLYEFEEKHRIKPSTGSLLINSESTEPTAPLYADLLSIKSIPNELLCVVCHDRQKCILLNPCLHVCLCAICQVQLTNCPVCKTGIEQKTIVYI